MKKLTTEEHILVSERQRKRDEEKREYFRKIYPPPPPRERPWSSEDKRYYDGAYVEMRVIDGYYDFIIETMIKNQREFRKMTSKDKTKMYEDYYFQASSSFKYIRDYLPTIMSYIDRCKAKGDGLLGLSACRYTQLI